MQQSDMSTMQVLPALTATDSPSVQQWQTWWNAMQHDDLAVAYADTFPRTLADFRYDIARRNKLLLLCLADHEVAGALWLHDLTCRPGSTVAAGWIGGYFLPSYRGGLVGQFWQVARPHWEVCGIRHFFSAVHVQNRPARVSMTQSLRFRRVGRFPDFTRFHGQLVDVFIYSLHAEDSALAWELAAARAAYQMSNVA